MVQKVCGCQIIPSSLVCDKEGDKTTVIYYARTPNQQSLDPIESWVAETNGTEVSGTKLLLNKDCPVRIKEMDNMKCKPATSGQQTGDSNAAAVAAPIVIILIVLAIAGLVLLTLFLLWRKRAGKSYNFFRYDTITHFNNMFK